ncbi:MAG: response regulator [Myxococcales bacterium]|nr:response regulator [Myxococcales bacterium]
MPGLLDGLDVGVIVQGVESEILYANQLALELLGLRRDQVMGVTSFDPSWDVVRPDGTSFPPDERPVARVLQSGVAERDVVLGVRRGTAQRHWLLANAIPNVGADGRIAYVVVTLSDISSERRRMNLLQQVKDELEDTVVERTSQLQSTVADLQQVTRALERSRGAFERVTEAVPGVLYQALRRSDGWVDLPFVSAYLRSLSGIEPTRAMNDPTCVLERIHPEDLPVVRRTLEEATRSGGTWECEVRLRGAAGDWRWVRNRAVPQEVPDGTRWSGVMLDVTEQRSLAEQIRVSQTREAIGAVTAGIAHNFNNALAVLVPNLEECLEAAPEALRAPLHESLQTAFSAAALVKQLMVIARSGVTDRQEPVELVGMIRDVSALCRRIFQGRVAVSESLAETSVRMMGHTASVRQVLLNLCINARDALQGIDGGTVAISLRVDHAHEPPMVAIEVRDDGCGMDEATLRRLGEPFFTTKPPGEGTGLGLATAFATIRSLGGQIRCESKRGEGSSITVLLPVLDFGEERAPVVEAGGPRPESERGRVLIIDDERLVRSALVKALRRRGFEVDEAGDGSEGLARVEAVEGDYQVVLLDLSMPGISGERVLERLKQDHPSLPVVILSGFVEDPAKVAAADAVLNKPLTTRALVATLDRVLGASSSPG